MSPSFVFALLAPRFFLSFSLITDLPSSPGSRFPRFPTFLLSSFQGDVPPFICSTVLFATSLTQLGLGHLSPDACLFSCPRSLVSVQARSCCRYKETLHFRPHCLQEIIANTRPAFKLVQMNSGQHLSFISADTSAAAPFAFCSVRLPNEPCVCYCLCLPFSFMEKVYFLSMFPHFLLHCFLHVSSWTTRGRPHFQQRCHRLMNVFHLSSGTVIFFRFVLFLYGNRATSNRAFRNLSHVPRRCSTAKLGLARRFSSPTSSLLPPQRRPS